MVVVLPMLGITWSWMLVKDGQLGNISDNVKGLNILLGRNGFVSQILSRLPEFIQPDFHPDQHDTKGLEKLWREKLFAEGGQLHELYSNPAA